MRPRTMQIANPFVSRPIMFGDVRIMTAAISMIFEAARSESRVVHDLIVRCTPSHLVDDLARTVADHASCEYVDVDGDHVFENRAYPLRPFADLTEDTGERMGGTGKFAGTSGFMRIRSRRLNSRAKGAIRSAVKVDGRQISGAEMAGTDRYRWPCIASDYQCRRLGDPVTRFRIMIYPDLSLDFRRQGDRADIPLGRYKPARHA